MVKIDRCSAAKLKWIATCYLPTFVPRMIGFVVAGTQLQLGNSVSIGVEHFLTVEPKLHQRLVILE